MKNRIKVPKSVRAILSLLFWVLVWSLLSLKVGKEVVLPSPWRVIVRLGELMGTSAFYKTVGLSVLRITLGFATAVVLGALSGAASHFSAVFDSLFSPLLSVIKATPVASFIILALVWMDKSIIASFISLLIVLPVIYSNVRAGFENTDVRLLEMAKIYNVGRGSVLTKIYIPSVAPYFRSGVRTCMGMAWKAGVAAEVLCTPKDSIGKMLNDSKLYLETVDLFAWTLSVIVISVVIEKLVMLFFRKKNGEAAS